MLFNQIEQDMNERANEQNQNQQFQGSEIDFSEFGQINRDLFRSKINEIENIADRELYDLVKETYSAILNDIMLKNDEQYIAAFMKPRFLRSLIQVVSNIQLQYYERVCCNKLAYDYFTYVQNPDLEVQELFYTLSEKINQTEVYRLAALGIPRNLAIQFALSRYSYTEEKINVQRLNFVIANADPSLITAQMVINIYQVLFDKFIPIFEGLIFDVFNEDEEWVTENIIDNYDKIKIAVLTILNDMEPLKIRKVLMSYTGNLKALYSNDLCHIRFSLRALSYDYERIVNMVDSLATEGIIVP